MKNCTLCKFEKPLTDFGKNRTKKDGLASECKSCRNARFKEWYSENTQLQRERCKASRKERHRRIKEYVWSYLITHPCQICGESDPIVLEFDHLGVIPKEINISVAVAQEYSIKRIQAEIDKCQVLCANCHRRKTAKDFGWGILDHVAEAC